MAKKEDEVRIYIKGDWQFPFTLDVREECVQINTVFLDWDKVSMLIKLLRTARTIGKKRRRLNHG